MGLGVTILMHFAVVSFPEIQLFYWHAREEINIIQSDNSCNYEMIFIYTQ